MKGKNMTSETLATLVHDETGDPCYIVGSERDMAETLFRPINGHTASGYVIKRAIRNIHVWLNNQHLVVNRWGVWCSVGKTPDGRPWYQYANLPYTLISERDAAEALAVDADWNSKGERQLIYRVPSRPML